MTLYGVEDTLFDTILRQAVGARDIESFATSLQNLTVLMLHHNRLRDEGASALQPSAVRARGRVQCQFK